MWDVASELIVGEIKVGEISKNTYLVLDASSDSTSRKDEKIKAGK